MSFFTLSRVNFHGKEFQQELNKRSTKRLEIRNLACRLRSLQPTYPKRLVFIWGTVGPWNLKKSQTLATSENYSKIFSIGKVMSMIMCLIGWLRNHKYNPVLKPKKKKSKMMMMMQMMCKIQTNEITWQPFYKFHNEIWVFINIIMDMKIINSVIILFFCLI